MKNEYTRIATLTAAAAAASSQLLLAYDSRARKLVETFVGPGVVEYTKGDVGETKQNSQIQPSGPNSSLGLELVANFGRCW